jgi:hypothetical protein
MFFTGIIALAQILLLPGMIFRSLYKFKGGFFYQLSVIISISMLLNATLIYPLVLLHLYTKLNILGLIIIEFLVLIWQYRNIFKNKIDDVGEAISKYASEVWNQMNDLFQSRSSSAATIVLRNILVICFLGLAISLVFWFLRRLTNNFGTVFNTWDAVVSWNGWAQIWSQNKVPSTHLTYPQLLPLNLSLTYLLIGNSQVSLFAKAVMPIFALMAVLMVFELAFQEKHYGYLIAVILIYLMYKKFLADYISDGYADIPVAFMTITALVPYFRNEDLLQKKKEFILSIMLASAAALTKQVGLFILFLLPITSLLNSKSRSNSQTKRTLLWFGVGFLLILPWYLPVGIGVLKDFSQLGIAQYISHSTQVQSSDSPLLRLGEAFIHLGKYLFLYLFMIPAFFLVKRRFKLLILFFLIPFSILWGIIASYSERNLSITFATLAVICGLGFEGLFEYGFQLLDLIRIGQLKAAFLFLLILFPIGYFSWKLTDKKIINIWTEAQSQIFSPEIDDQLYAMDRSDPNCKLILTNYPVNYLPGFEGTQLNSYFNDYGIYEKYLLNTTVCWMLVPNGIDSSVNDEIEQNLNDGKYELLFTTDKWIPYRLIKIR